jgi:cytochrome c oxidase assembly factor CtaG
MNWLKKLWRAEPVIVSLLTNAAFWPTAFTVASAFGHPIADGQQHALIGASALISGLIVRQNVVAPDTADQHIADVVSANNKVGV